MLYIQINLMYTYVTAYLLYSYRIIQVAQNSEPCSFFKAMKGSCCHGKHHWHMLPAWCYVLAFVCDFFPPFGAPFLLKGLYKQSTFLPQKKEGGDNARKTWKPHTYTHKFSWSNWPKPDRGKKNINAHPLIQVPLQAHACLLESNSDCVN